MRISDWSSDVCSSDLDYDTPDGTCIRDFIHVSDLARAHVNALDYLRDHRESLTLNCGYGRGHSVREVLDGIRRISGRDIPTRIAPRRPGDVATLVADPSRLRSEEHTSELQSLMRISYAVFCLKKKKELHRTYTQQ